VILRPTFEAPTVVAGFDDTAVMSEAIERRGGHFGVDVDHLAIAVVEAGKLAPDALGGVLIAGVTDCWRQGMSASPRFQLVNSGT
jgi:hypothetical protein